MSGGKRFSNYNYGPGNMTTILKQAKLEPLKERRKQNRLILFCKGVHHLVEIPTDNLQRPLRTCIINIISDFQPRPIK
jgi:hypothetical protein